MWKLTKSPESAPDTPERIVIEFKQGVPSKVKVGSTVRSTLIPWTCSSRSTPSLAPTVSAESTSSRTASSVSSLVAATNPIPWCHHPPCRHLDLEGLTLDREVRRIRDQVITQKFSEQLYYGFFFSPECEFVRSCIPQSQKTVNGYVQAGPLQGKVNCGR